MFVIYRIKNKDKEENFLIHKKERENFMAKVKDINSSAIEDDCNVIVKYKSTNCSKLKVYPIQEIVFVEYHK